MRLVFCGNCQTHALHFAYNLFVVPHTGDETAYIYHQHMDQPRTRALAAAAEVIVDQILPHDHRQPLPDANPAALRIQVPSVGGTFLWPYAGVSHPDSFRRYKNYHPFSGDLGDAWLVRRLQAGQAAGAAEAYAGLDIGRVARLDRRMEMTLDSQAALDRQAGTDFAGLIERHFRTERMFRTPYHAEARIMRHMLALVMRHTGAPQDAWTGAENLLQASLFGAKDLPVHPGVAAHFGLRWTGPQTETRFFSETYLSFTGWADRFLRCEAYPAVSHAVQAVLQRHPAGPDLLQAAAPSLPDSPLVRYAQAIVSMRAGMADQALPMLLALESARPDLPHVNATLFEAYKNCGQPHEAEAALRREIASTPHIRGLYRQLLDVLVAQGRQTEAATLRRTMAMLGRGKPATANEVAMS